MLMREMQSLNQYVKFSVIRICTLYKKYFCISAFIIKRKSLTVENNIYYKKKIVIDVIHYLHE